MTIDITQPIGDLTAAFPAASRVFERLGIDYCCQGRRSLSEACSRRGLDLAEVVRQLEQEQRTPRDGADAPVDDVLALIDYIERTHHAFTRAELVRLLPLAEKVKRVHGANRPEVVSVHNLLGALAEDLEPHMRKEEQVLFPYVRSLARRQPAKAPFPSVVMPIHAMHHDHERVGWLLEELSAVTNGYQPPADACASYRALYDGLATLQTDIHRHVHLENNVLFPAAEQLELSLAARA